MMRARKVGSKSAHDDGVALLKSESGDIDCFLFPRFSRMDGIRVAIIVSTSGLISTL